MFGNSVRLFSLLGFEVKIDLSWIFIAILITWSLSTGFFPFHYKNLSTSTYWLMGIIGALGLFLSIIVHEFSHSIVARRYGLPMKGITLFIFGGVAEMGDEPTSPKTEFLMAVAGPLASIGIALVFLAIYLSGQTGWLPRPISAVVGYLALINGVLAAFNLVPAFPLDGGRILRSALWKFKDNIRWATRVSASIGSGFGIMLIVLGLMSILMGNLIGGMWWGLIGFFLYSAAKSSYQQLLTRRALEGEQVSRFMKTDPITVPSDATISTLVNDYIYKFHFKMFPVIDSDRNLIGYVTTKQVKEIPKEKWPDIHVVDIVRGPDEENTVGASEDAMKALAMMSKSRQSRLLVADGNRLLGVITLKDLLEFLSLKIELDEQ
ncbi:MAG: site-2 protease family protein [Desulfobacterales bacterium]